MTLISVSQANKTFAMGTPNETKALVDVNLNISPGEFVVLIGSNGSGKSTFLNALAGSIRLDSGKIMFENESVSDLPGHKRSRWVSRIFQNPLAGTAPDLTVIDNFRLASIRTKTKSLQIGIDQKFKNHVKEKISMLGLGLENKTEQLMRTLSGGQRQALTLVMATMDDAKIILMDEPTAALDPKTADLIMKLSQKIITEFNLTALLVTHQMKDAYAFGNRLLYMKEGCIVKNLDLSEKQKLSLNDLYNLF